MHLHEVDLQLRCISCCHSHSHADDDLEVYKLRAYEMQTYFAYGISSSSQYPGSHYQVGYQGIARLVTGNCKPIRIPSHGEIESNALEAMRLRPSFVIAIWTPDIKTGYFNSGDLHSADGMWFRMPNGMAVQPQLLRPYHSHL